MICRREEGEKKGKGGRLMGKRERGRERIYSGQKKGLDRW